MLTLVVTIEQQEGADARDTFPSLRRRPKYCADHSRNLVSTNRVLWRRIYPGENTPGSPVGRFLELGEQWYTPNPFMRARIAGLMR